MVPLLGQAIRSNPGFRTNSIERNDDDSSPRVPIGFTINFFGNQQTNCWVNNNGNITFDSELPEYTPDPIQGARRQIIAAFWADVDTRGARSSRVTYGNDTVGGRSAFGANYQNVGYYDSADDKLNSFQIILIERSDTGAGNFDIEFNYERILWETRDASDGRGGLGGSSARVGYSNGTATAGSSFELPGSGVPGTFLDSGPSPLIRQTLNSDVPGRLLFQVRNGQVTQSISANPISLTFRQATAGGLAPSGQSVNLSANTGQVQFAITATGTSGTTNWLNVTQQGSVTPSTLAVSVAAGSLPVGGYSGSIRVTPNSAAIAPITIPVYLNIGTDTPFAVRNGVVNGASFASGVIAPGSLFSIFGEALAASNGFAPSLPLPVSLNNVQVLINGTAVPLVFVSPGQINAQVPFTVPVGRANIELVRNGVRSVPVVVDVAQTLPGIFLVPPTNFGAIQNQSGRANTAADPARVGEAIVVYMTGLGAVTNAPAPGAASPSNPLATTTLPVTASIGGRPATVEFAGLTPGFVGLGQVNIRVPALTTTGPLPLIVRVNNVESTPVLVNTRQP
jgi:uncharacterized protein (TIGR03437 family)